MISLAQKDFPPSKYPNLTFTHLDATKLNFKNQFDIAFSNATLHWVKDHICVLKGVKGSLKGSGRILFQMGGKGNAQDIINVVDRDEFIGNIINLYLKRFPIDDNGLVHGKMVRLEVEAVNP